MRSSAALIAAAFATPLASCKSIEPPPPPPQLIAIRVTSDPGKPVADASLTFNGAKVGVTGVDGVGVLKLVGKDGESFSVTVACPEGFESPAKPVQVLLKRLADQSKMPEYAATCPPTNRTVVVAVRAENGPDLPVLYLGREVARTDASGAAHVMLKLPPGDEFSLTLSTGDDKLIKPQSPVASFAVGNRDDVVLFDQRFERAKPVIRSSGPRRRGPIKM